MADLVQKWEVAYQNSVKVHERRESSNPADIQSRLHVNSKKLLVRFLYQQVHSPQDLQKPTARLSSVQRKTHKLLLLQANVPKLPLENRSLYFTWKFKHLPFTVSCKPRLPKSFPFTHRRRTLAWSIQLAEAACRRGPASTSPNQQQGHRLSNPSLASEQPQLY